MERGVKGVADKRTRKQRSLELKAGEGCFLQKQHVLHSCGGRRESCLSGKPGWVDAESNGRSPEDENQSPDPTSTEPSCLRLSEALYVNQAPSLASS